MRKGTLVKHMITDKIERVGIVVSEPYILHGATEELRGTRYKVCWQDHPVFKVISTIPCIEPIAEVDLEVVSLPRDNAKG